MKTREERQKAKQEKEEKKYLDDLLEDSGSKVVMTDTLVNQGLISLFTTIAIFTAIVVLVVGLYHASIISETIAFIGIATASILLSVIGTIVFIRGNKNDEFSE